MRNLLPEAGRNNVAVEYHIRLATVALFVIAAVALMGSALLLPAYFLAWVARSDAQTRADLANQSLAQENFAAAAQSERSAAALYESLRGQLARPRASQVITALAGQRVPGISLRRIEYDEEGTAPPSVRLSGIATTRDNLLSFKQALLKVPGVGGVDLPLDALTTAFNVEFALTVTYASSSPSH